jgi:thiol-disulfide isomerase/thioredoxin
MNDMFRWVKKNLEARLPAEAQRPPAPDPAPTDPAGPPPPPKPRFFGRHFWTGFGFGVIAFVALLVAGSMLLALWMRRTMESAAPGANADAFLSAPQFPATGAASDFALGLETADGIPFDAGSVRGKAVFLNYWATWCGPCRAEMPSIQRLYAKTRDLGVVFLLVSDEKPEKIKAYLQKNAFTMPIYRSTKSRPAAYQTQGIPATFILASDGRIAFSHVGAARWDDDSALAFLRSLPASSAAKP